MIVRGVYHAHSRFSGDGHFLLSELKEEFKKRGLRFVIMTEHAEDLTPERYRAFYSECAAQSDETFLFIPGLEVPFEGKIHVGCFPAAPAYDAVPLFAPGIAAMREHGAITIFHHPSKQSYFMTPDFRRLLDGVEVWNSRYEGVCAPSRRTIEFAKEHFKDNLFLGGLDLHREQQFGGPCLEVRVESPTVGEITDAIRCGNFALAGRFYRFDKKTFLRPSNRVWYLLVRYCYEVLRYLRNAVTRLLRGR